MKSITRVRKVGGSLVVTIPKEVVKIKEIKKGEALVVEFEKIKKSGFGILEGIKPFSKEDELTTHD